MSSYHEVIRDKEGKIKEVKVIHSPQSEKSVALKRAEGTHGDSCDCQLCSDVRKLHLGTTKNKSQEKCGGSDKIGCAKCGIYNICKKCKQWAQVNKDRLCGGCDNQNHTNCPYTGKKGYVPEEECHCFCCGTHKGSGNQNQDCANKEMKK